jgi:hypothetical protein
MAKEWKTFADARKTMTELLQGAFAVGFVAGFQQGKVAGGDPTEINLEKKLWRMGGDSGEGDRDSGLIVISIPG